MRVLFLHTAVDGAFAEYKVHATLAAHAKKLGFEPYFIWQKPINLDTIGGEHILSYDFGRDMSLTPKLSRYRRGSLMLRKLPQSIAFLSSRTKEIKPDVIYTSQQIIDVRFARFLSRRFNLPHIIHIHYSVGPWLGKYALGVIQQSTHLIAVSEYVRQTALLQGVKPSSIHTVVNPNPVVQPHITSQPRSVRAEFNIAEDAPLVVAVGRLDPGKGHLALLEAFAQVLQHIPHARLLICGSSTSRDNYEGALRQKAHDLHIATQTIFAGQRTDIQAILRSATLFCLPTELDPCPLVFLEAMAEGVPVVALYSGGVPEMVLQNQTGLLSYPGDIAALAANLQKVLTNPGLAHDLGMAGRQRAVTEFSPTTVANRWIEVVQAQVT